MCIVWVDFVKVSWYFRVNLSDFRSENCQCDTFFFNNDFTANFWEFGFFGAHHLLQVGVVDKWSVFIVYQIICVKFSTFVVIDFLLRWSTMKRLNFRFWINGQIQIFLSQKQNYVYNFYKRMIKFQFLRAQNNDMYFKNQVNNWVLKVLNIHKTRNEFTLPPIKIKPSRIMPYSWFL